MFEDQHNEQDLMFRSILESGQEEVPGRVWDGVASELARREKAVLWWKRTAAGVAAAAAVMVGESVAGLSTFGTCAIYRPVSNDASSSSVATFSTTSSTGAATAIASPEGNAISSEG